MTDAEGTKETETEKGRDTVDQIHKYKEKGRDIVEQIHEY